MAKRKPPAHDKPQLFEQYERARARRLRRQRALFIPHYLTQAATNQQLVGDAQQKAYDIVCHWANLESSGKLAQHKETSIDTQFLDQIFGEGLGYSVKTKSPEAWQL